MRSIPTVMADALAGNDFTGDQRAVTRVTIQRVALGVYPAGDEVYSSIVFPGSTEGARELPNVKSARWQRSTDSMVATASLELWNTAPLPPGSLPEVGDTFDQLGYYTFNRARSPYSRSTWLHRANVWQDMLVPDRVVRIYQGYGADYSVVPELDPHLLLMGCFLIDEVTYNADGLISVECRDYARMLQEQIAFPPVVPLAKYPLQFEKFHQEADPPKVTVTGSVAWVRPAYDTDSNVPYLGRNGSQYGHHGTDAFDSSTSSYWLSVGNARPRDGYSFEHIQGKFPGGATISAARCRVWGGPYMVYLSVRVGDRWQGAQKVPYDPRNPASAPNGSDIPFLQSARVLRDGQVEFTFEPMAGVTAVRFSFTDLFNSGLGTFRYRAGVRSVEVVRDSRVSTTTTSSHTEGNFEDYTDIVKRLLAYGGFYWPQDGRTPLTNTTVETQHFASSDPILAAGRIWGDLMISGAPGTPPADYEGLDGAYFGTLGVELFDKQPLLNGIAYVRDMLGFIFYIDEHGAAVFRLPNLFSAGSWRTNARDTGAARTTDFLDIRDEQVILGLRSKLSSRNLRERVLIGNADGSLGAVARGRIPHEVGFRRVGIWTDQNFDRLTDVVVMADMITLRQLFTYRQNSLTIPADPRIQIDDQVRLTERTTGERYLHYVSAISSAWDADSGKWTYELTTSWLGADPEGEWAFHTDDLSEELKTYIAAVQK